MSQYSRYAQISALWPSEQETVEHGIFSPLVIAAIYCNNATSNKILNVYTLADHYSKNVNTPYGVQISYTPGGRECWGVLEVRLDIIDAWLQQHDGIFAEMLLTVPAGILFAATNMPDGALCFLATALWSFRFIDDPSELMTRVS